MKSLNTLLAVGLLGLLAGCASSRDRDWNEYNTDNTRRSAATGAVAGAVIGGLIGHQSGETAAGAAIGAAAGGIAGGAYGHRQDQVQGRVTGADYGTSRDSYGYTGNDYISLLTANEMNILRSRAQGASTVVLADYLTEQEKANLRARAQGRR
jgi:uncharacterized membrane protein YebE (DUF533 family)